MLFALEQPDPKEQDYGYLVRVNSKLSMHQLFDTGRYYTRLIRHWKSETKIIFLMKIHGQDSIIGYGMPRKIIRSPDEVKKHTLEYGYWERNEFMQCIVFRKIIKLKDPVPIRGSPIRKLGKTGALLHGAKVGWERIDDTLHYIEYGTWS